MKSTITKSPASSSKKTEAPKEFPLQNDTVAFLEERIADGGATTDHLQVMLDKLKPKEEVEA